MDSALRDWVLAHRNGTLTEVMVNASRFGSTPSLIVIALAAAALLAWRGSRRDSLLIVGCSAGVFLLGPLLKLLFTRPRPPEREHLVDIDSWSFPSGHSLNSMVVIGLLTVLAIRGRSVLTRVLVGAVGALLVLVVGFSRVYLGVHWPTDVLAGWLTGAVWLTLCLLLARITRGNTTSSGTVDASS